MDSSGQITANAQAVSTNVFPIVQETPIGSIHSVFANSFNLIFGERLVHIGSMENGLAPFGIGIQPNDASSFIRFVRRDQHVMWNQSSNSLLFDGGISLALDHAQHMNLSLQKASYDQAILIQNMNGVLNRLSRDHWQTGIVDANQQQTLLHYLQSSFDVSSSHRALAEMAKLASLVQDDKTITPQAVFDYWIGRGIGLTPSGDDLITGMCAMLSVLNGRVEPLHGQLQSYVLENGLKRTTPIGCEYLVYAARQQFHTHLINMCHSLLQPEKVNVQTALDEMKKIGHTSGADTLIGILLAIKVITA
ncbi:DUF2877 domain-containing protein [Lentibacillus sp. N15]|uniref:DUF2877 domain-containing protein n=1 Tax=Lentibacillus songyuanensis TaxID=3136161 RepID=UPI0031BACAA3